MSKKCKIGRAANMALRQSRAGDRERWIWTDMGSDVLDIRTCMKDQGCPMINSTPLMSKHSFMRKNTQSFFLEDTKNKNTCIDTVFQE